MISLPLKLSFTCLSHPEQPLKWVSASVDEVTSVVSFLGGILSPEAFIETITTLNPASVVHAVKLVAFCVGGAS